MEEKNIVIGKREKKGVIGIAIAAVILILFRGIFNIIFIPTESMMPTIQKNNICLGWHLPFVFGDPFNLARGDIITFFSENGKYQLCKRIIGVEGDEIDFADGYVFINGEMIDEPYLQGKADSYSSKSFYVPKNCVFCLGDNRENSEDSRFFNNPYISVDRITNKIIYIF